MTLPNVPEVPASEVVDELRAKLEAQPWYARFSNTVTSAVGSLALIIWLVTANGVEFPGGVSTGIGSGIAVLTVLGVLKTKNGVTPRGIETVERIVEKTPDVSLFPRKLNPTASLPRSCYAVRLEAVYGVNLDASPFRPITLDLGSGTQVEHGLYA